MKTRSAAHRDVEKVDVPLVSKPEAPAERGTAPTKAWHGDGVRLPMAPAESNLMTRTECALTEHEAADRLRLSVATLRNWRYLGKGPTFVRFGRAVRYLPSNVDDFILANTVLPSDARLEAAALVES
jgi:Helix-turn-helix domain